LVGRTGDEGILNEVKLVTLFLRIIRVKGVVPFVCRFDLSIRGNALLGRRPSSGPGGKWLALHVVV
jgi:hypothetical protein